MSEKMDYLDSLNPNQREAVVYCDGPQLVIAGAGSGKTRVLTMKIAYLLQHGHQPDRILALTFTKKAATEMKTRIGQIVGPALSRRLWMGTFHSMFARILRREAARIGFQPDFTIYDQADSRSLIKAIVKEMNLDDKKYKPASVQAQISNAKNNLVTPGMYRANAEIRDYDLRSGRDRLSEIYQVYWNRCRQAGAMDFDDLLLYTNILFRDCPDVLETYQDYFSYVLVDEYQDTNRAQHLIVEQLVRRHRCLCVVGDDAQSIYSFRGANIRNILDMGHSVPGTKLFKLERNYRSTQNIVDAANSLIAKNREQIPKHIFSERERGSLLEVCGTYSDLEEAQTVSRRIARLHDEDSFRYADIAILYRTNAQSRTLEEALRKRGIDYRIYGGLSFYQRKEIKDILAYMRLTVNPADEEAFRRVVNYPARGIGDTTLAKVGEAVTRLGTTFMEVCRDPIGCGVSVNRGTAAKLQAFVALIDSFRELNAQLGAFRMAEHIIIASGIRADLNADTTVEGQSRRENVEELMSAIQVFVLSSLGDAAVSGAFGIGNPSEGGVAEDGSSVAEAAVDSVRLIDFLADISLSGDVEPEGNGDDAERDCVTMMTIHSAKGLEFPNVFIVGVEDGLLPSDLSFSEPNGVEEERRLFYVAITRAEQNCFLSYALSRFRNGRSEPARPSRFLKDIDRRYLHEVRPPASFDYSANLGGSFGGAWGGSVSGSFDGGSSFAASKPRTLKPMGTSSARPSSSRPASAPSAPEVTTTASPASPTSARSADGQVFGIGQRVEHDRFGEGVIRRIEGQGSDARLSIRFDTNGDKTLLLKFAKIRLL